MHMPQRSHTQAAGTKAKPFFAKHVGDCARITEKTGEQRALQILYARRARLYVAMARTQRTCNPKRRTCSTKLAEDDGGRAGAAVLSICGQAGRCENRELRVQKDTDKTTAPRTAPLTKSPLFWLKFSNPAIARCPPKCLFHGGGKASRDGQRSLPPPCRARRAEGASQQD